MATVMSPSPAAGPTTNVEILELGDDEILYEVVDNEIRELPPMSARETYLASTLLRVLSPFAWNSGLGRVQIEMLHLIIPAKNLQRRPDLSFVSFKRWPRDRPVPTTNAWDVVPNLAVEVVSPTNTANGIMEKTKEYFEAGVERVLVIYPEFAEIYDYSSPTAVQILTLNQSLEGGTLLPGFQLPLTDLFDVKSESETDASA